MITKYNWVDYVIFLKNNKKIENWKNTVFWKKTQLTYTNRIYKIFVKKKFIKMQFNYAHINAMILNKKVYFKNLPYDKTIDLWYKENYKYFNKSLKIIQKIRPINYYTWRGINVKHFFWTKKIGKISEYT